jgi:hypothetical protein
MAVAPDERRLLTAHHRSKLYVKPGAAPFEICSLLGFDDSELAEHAK